MELSYDVVHDSICQLLHEMSVRTGVSWKYRSVGTGGKYNPITNQGSIGGEMLSNGKYFGIVSAVNYVSMHKQCFHEYRHWQQYNEFFMKKNTDGMSDKLIEQMAVQSMIASVLPNYVRSEIARSNYWNMIMEIDAEEYALRESRTYLRKQGILTVSEIDSYMRDEVNRRIEWWG